MTTTLAAPKLKVKARSNTQSYAFQALKQINNEFIECPFKNNDTRPFTENASFHQLLATYLRIPNFELTHGHWHEIVKRAADEIKLPDGLGYYPADTITRNKYGACITFVAMTLALNFGKKWGVSKLRRLSAGSLGTSVPEEMSEAAAFRMIVEAKDRTSAETLQSTIIRKLYNPPQVIVHIKRFMNRVLNEEVTKQKRTPESVWTKELDTTDEWGSSSSPAYQVAFNPEDQIQLEYLQDFMSRALYDLNDEQKLVFDAWSNDANAPLIAGKRTFLSQVTSLDSVLGITKSKLTTIAKSIVKVFQQLCGVEFIAKMRTRYVIKSLSQRWKVARNLHAFSASSNSAELISKTESINEFKSPYITGEDFDLMISAVKHGVKLLNSPEFALD